MTIIDVQEVTKVYYGSARKRGIVALDNVSLSIPQGEIFGLLGPNGAGKTTFLKVVLGIVQPNTGRIEVAGYRPTDPRSRQQLGYLPENHRFPDHHTGLSLLEFTGRLYGLSRSEIDARTERLLKIVNMARWTGMKIKKYSKGMQQRIGLAQAMMPDPDVLLLDEPTDGVDPVGKVEIRDVLKAVREEGKTIVLNSHLLSEVESVVDRVAILSRGRVVKVSTIDELTVRESQYEIQADIGNKLINIPEEVGRVLSVSTNKLIVELVSDDQVNYVIDELRLKKIAIKSVQPLKLTLEQSFMEAVRQPTGATSSGDQS